VTAPGELDETRERLRRAVTDAGELGLDVALLGARERAVLALTPDLVVASGRVRPVAAQDTLAEHPYLRALAAGALAPPPPDGVDRATLRELVKRGYAVERDGIWFHAGAIDAASRTAAALLAEHPEGFTVAQFRDRTGATRKFALPLLNELDARGVTRRRDDVRIAGPRLPEVVDREGVTFDA
jgi:selenocysteine-specific elongation factor